MSGMVLIYRTVRGLLGLTKRITKMKELFESLGPLLAIAVVAMLMVIVAMGVDLVSGWRKASTLGEAHTSYGFSRSLTKFLIYEGVLLISTCIDVLLHFGLYQVSDVCYEIPCTTLLLGIVLCFIELWSVYEKAEQKQRRKAEAIVSAASKMVDKNELADTIAKALTIALTRKEATDGDKD